MSGKKRKAEPVDPGYRRTASNVNTSYSSSSEAAAPTPREIAAPAVTAAKGGSSADGISPSKRSHKKTGSKKQGSIATEPDIIEPVVPPLALPVAPSGDFTQDDAEDTMEDDDGTRNIIVAVRKRPFRPGGVEVNELDVVTVDEVVGKVELLHQRSTLDNRGVKETKIGFTFDVAFDAAASNAYVYVRTARPLLEMVKKGKDAVIFAFGQTGSGKTHTMLGARTGMFESVSGVPDAGSPTASGSEHGLCALAAKDMLSTFKGMKLSVSFYEIYGSKVFDLLNERSKLKMLEDENHAIQLVGLVELPLTDHAALLELMAAGSQLRAAGETHANDRSSRSHAVLVINVRTRRDPQLFSRMIFIDLAGSERAADTYNLDKSTRMEGAEINRSLLALKECVRAMQRRKRHVPFRGSKLTQVLRDSFVGNCATCMIANISPCGRHMEDSLNTLRYADRIKELKVADMAEGYGSGNEAEGAANRKKPRGMVGNAEPDLCPKCGFPFFMDNPQTHICPKTYVPCPHCRLDVVKKNLAQHIESCLDAPANCPMCHKPLKRGELPQHACPKASITCPYCHKVLQKDQLSGHVANDCPSVKQQCRLCRECFPRARIDTHERLECPMRQVTCPTCGFLMRHQKYTIHALTCSSRTRGNFGGSFAAGGLAPPTPSAAGRRDSTTLVVPSLGGTPGLRNSPPQALVPPATPTTTAAPVTSRTKPSLAGIRIATQQPTGLQSSANGGGRNSNRTSTPVTARPAVMKRSEQLDATNRSFGSTFSGTIGRRPQLAPLANVPPLPSSSSSSNVVTNPPPPVVVPVPQKVHHTEPPAATSDASIKKEEKPIKSKDPAPSASKKKTQAQPLRAKGAAAAQLPSANVDISSSLAQAADLPVLSSKATKMKVAYGASSKPSGQAKRAWEAAASPPQPTPPPPTTQKTYHRSTASGGEDRFAASAEFPSDPIITPPADAPVSLSLPPGAKLNPVNVPAHLPPEAILACPYASQGCGFTAVRHSELIDHMVNGMQMHLDQVQAHAASLRRENSQLRRRVQELESTPSAR